MDVVKSKASNTFIVRYEGCVRTHVSLDIHLLSVVQVVWSVRLETKVRISANLPSNMAGALEYA